MGLASYWGGEAGEAKCRTYRTSPPKKIPWLTSACRNSKSGLLSSSRKFSREPVMKLSSATTRMPLPRSASHRWEPMKPAPPETIARGLFASNSSIREPMAAHHGGVIDVSTLDHDRLPHRPLQWGPGEGAKLVPLGDHYDRIGAPRRLVN